MHEAEDSQSPRGARRRASRGARALVLGAIALGLLANVAPAGASEIDKRQHTSRSASATWTAIDARNTSVNVALAYERPSNATAHHKIDVTLTQSYCDTSGAVDQLVTVDVGRHLTLYNPTGVTLDPRRGSARLQRTITLLGSMERVPAGTDDTCSAPDPAAMTTRYMTPSITFDLTWTARTAVISYGNGGAEGRFTHADARASGQASSSILGLQRLPSTNDAFLWSGYWEWPPLVLP